ncbi:response regulator, partial [Sinorhizobium meliloti]
MPLSTRIAPHLPYLRRYARAVTGSQAAGDAYVAAVLEALIDDLELFPAASNDRIGLYKLFCSLF